MSEQINLSSTLQADKKIDQHPENIPLNKHPKKFEDPAREEEHCLTAKLFIITLSFMTGLYSLSALASFMYQKEILKLSAAQIQLIASIVAIPWAIKFVFGYSYDLIIRKIKKSKYLIILVSLIRITVLIILYFVKMHWSLFLFLAIVSTFCGLYENIVSECMLVIMTKQENEKLQNQKANHLPLFFGYRAFGQLIGGFFGGRIITYISIKAAFLISILLPIIMIIICLFYKEKDFVPATTQKTFREELYSIQKLLAMDKVVQMIIFVCLINATPNFDAITTFYQTDYLKFTTEDLANFQTFATLCYVIAMVIYSYCLQKTDPYKLFLSTNFMLWIVNVSFMLVVTDYITNWGLSVKLFCLFNSGVYSFISELNFMPIIAIWCAICPRGLEATSITLLTAFINFSSNLGVYLGALIMIIMRIKDGQYGELWILLLIQNLYLIVMIIMVAFVEFPDPTRNIPIEELPISDRQYNIEFFYNE